MSEKPVVEGHPNHSEDWHLRGCAAFDKRTAGAQKSRLGSLRAVLTNADRRWDNEKIITYCFVKPVGTRSQQNKVKQVIKEWESYVNIKFKFVSGRNATIRIAFEEDEGSWSYIARDIETTPPRERTMNFSWISADPEISEEDRGVILHEFGHSLGFLHEHQSLRRSEKITLDEEAVIEFYTRTQGWTPEEVRRQILDVYDVNEVSSFSSIDLTSIMMYFMPKEMNIERIEVKPNNELSELDKAYGFINYPFITTESPDPKWTITHALDIANVQGASRRRILDEFYQRDWKGVRTEFALWSLNEKAIAINSRLQNQRSGVGNQQQPIKVAA